jgi:hypothetical protein
MKLKPAPMATKQPGAPARVASPEGTQVLGVRYGELAVVQLWTLLTF